MFIQAHRRWRLMLAILSLSLLTVMAGAAVAPALDVIQQNFSGEPVILIQLIMAGMDIAQFTAPTIIAAIQAGFGSVSGTVTSYEAAILLSVVMLLWVGVFDRKKN